MTTRGNRGGSVYLAVKIDALLPVGLVAVRRAIGVLAPVSIEYDLSGSEAWDENCMNVRDDL